MSDQFLGEIKMVAFTFAPKGWVLCNGQTLPVSQYQALFSLIGTTYGGDGRTTFVLPNLQGRVPMHTGNGFSLGQIAGEASYTLQVADIPPHTHTLMAKAAVNANPATGVAPGPTVALAEAVAATGATLTPVQNFGTGTPNLHFASNALAIGGGGQPHPNQQPYAVVTFCMALVGIFPSPT